MRLCKVKPHKLLPHDSDKSGSKMDGEGETYGGGEIVLNGWTSEGEWLKGPNRLRSEKTEACVERLVNEVTGNDEI